MMAYVAANNKTYQLVGGTTNSDWVAVITGAGGVDGSGTATQVAYWTDSDTISSLPLVYDSGSGELSYSGGELNLLANGIGNADFVELANNSSITAPSTDQARLWWDNGSDQMKYTDGGGDTSIIATLSDIIDGSGDTDKIAYWTDSDTLSYLPVQYYDDTDPTRPNTLQFFVDNDDGTEWPSFQLLTTSASPAADDVIGEYKFAGYDSGSTVTTYAVVRSVIDTATDGSEDGHLELQVVDGGSMITPFIVSHSVDGSGGPGIKIGQGMKGSFGTDEITSSSSFEFHGIGTFEVWTEGNAELHVPLEMNGFEITDTDFVEFNHNSDPGSAATASANLYWQNVNQRFEYLNASDTLSQIATLDDIFFEADSNGASYAGNIGIGGDSSSTSSYKLRIYDSTNSAYALIETGGSSNSAAVEFKAGGSPSYPWGEYLVGLSAGQSHKLIVMDRSNQYVGIQSAQDAGSGESPRCTVFRDFRVAGWGYGDGGNYTPDYIGGIMQSTGAEMDVYNRGQITIGVTGASSDIIMTPGGGARTVQISTGDLQLGRSYVAGAPSATGYLVVRDASGTQYKIPAEAL
jgi:hypothetical protein